MGGSAEHVGNGGGLDRRPFLKYGVGTLAGTLAVGNWRLLPAAAQRAEKPVRKKGSCPKPSLTAVLRRREDQLRLDVEFYNLKLDTTGLKAVLVRQKQNQDAHVVVVFPPQHVMEEAGYEYDKAVQDAMDLGGEPKLSDDPPPPPVGARLAGATRLAFLIPPEKASIPFDLDGLLEWEEWTPSLVPVADDALLRPERKLQPPGPLHTAIELPWWLQLSPHAQTGWVHAAEPVTRNGRTELWHTRFGGRVGVGPVDEADQQRMTVRAVWTRDPQFADYLGASEQEREGPSLKPPDGEDFEPFHPIGMPFRTPLSPRDRYELVISTSDFEHLVSAPPFRLPNGNGVPGYTPLPASVDRMMLTALGGWLDLHGSWQAGTGAEQSGTLLESWRHIATTGRDQYVRIVKKGFLFPFGFAASLVKVTERKFRTIGSGGPFSPKRRVAYLLQRYFLIVRQRQVAYGGSLHQNEGRKFPFTQVRTRTLITPNLDEPGSGGPTFGNWSSTEAFVPRVAEDPFRFHLVGTDRVGRAIDLHAPVVFVDGDLATQSDIGDVIHTYNGDNGGLGVTHPARTIDLRGSAVAVAAIEEGAPPGATDLEIHRFTLGAQMPTGFGQHPAFFPTMHEAEVRLAAAEAVLGGPSSNWPVVEFDGGYLASDFATPGEVFVRLAGTSPAADLDFGGAGAGDRAGGVITPNLRVTALSRRTGPVAGDVNTFQDGTFTPSQFFGGLKATLLGDITLGQVIRPIDFNLADDRLVRLNTRNEEDATLTELRWLPELQNVPPGASDNTALFIAKRGSTLATLDILATITTPKGAPESATFLVRGDLRNFQVALLPGGRFIIVGFDRLRFQTETGKKTDVDVEIAEVEFAGPLEFVNKLKDYLSFSAGGFEIELLPTHLDAGFALPIPNISIGVFSLSNIAFRAGAVIPFTGQPVRFRFGFSSQDNPFLLSVMIFGGGGFFELALGPDGIEAFQAALEFGVVAAMDFGVASGSVRLTAGIYFAIGIPSSANPEGNAELTGFLTIKGQVRVIGIITVTILLEAGFTYIPATKKALVRASVMVEVKVAFIGGSVEVEFERRFGGSADPTFGETFTELDWAAYADAFAPIGA